MIIRLKNKLDDLYFKFCEYRFFKREIKKIMPMLSKNPEDDKYATILTAMYKQIPKAVNEYEDYDGDDEDNHPIIRYFYGCPSCKKNIYRPVKYCSSCGQKLSFENTWR